MGIDKPTNHEKSDISDKEEQVKPDYGQPPTPEEVKNAKMTDQEIRDKGPLWYACMLVAKYPQEGFHLVRNSMQTYWPQWENQVFHDFFIQTRRWYESGGTEEKAGKAKEE